MLVSDQKTGETLSNFHFRPGEVAVGDRLISGRICATRRSPSGAQKERNEMLQDAKRKQRQVHDKTLELADYFLLFTTLPEPDFSTMAFIRIYRLRWQIELVFKRLKSILQLGHLHKYDPSTLKQLPKCFQGRRQRQFVF